MIALTVILVFIIFLSWSWWKLNRNRKKVNVPGPIPLPLVGNGLQFIMDGCEFLKTIELMIRLYGDAVMVHLFSSPFVLFAHPKYIEPILSSYDMITKGKSYKLMEPWLGQGLLTSTGQRWKTHRKYLTPAFHFNILQNFLPVFNKNAGILVEKLKPLSGGKSRDFFPIIANLALDNVTESIMGVSCNAQQDDESKYVKAVNVLSDIISIRQRNPFLTEDAIFNLVPMRKKQEHALKVLHEQTRHVIERRRQELSNLNTSQIQSSELGIKNKYAFLDLLLLTQENGEKIPNEHVREEVDTFMFEGHDTITSAIVFSLYCLAMNKDVQDKILLEQKSIVGDTDRDPTYSELHQMKYLEAVVKESLRLHPSVPLFQRLVTKDTEIHNYRLSKGTTVIIDAFHMQRHPDVYEDPLSFKPERFESQNGNSKSHFSWIAFSAGPRNCIGQKFAMMEMKVTLAAIVKKFELFPADIAPELTANMILRSTTGVHLKILKRNKS